VTKVAGLFCFRDRHRGRGRHYHQVLPRVARSGAGHDLPHCLATGGHLGAAFTLLFSGRTERLGLQSTFVSVGPRVTWTGAKPAAALVGNFLTSYAAWSAATCCRDPTHSYTSRACTAPVGVSAKTVALNQSWEYKRGDDMTEESKESTQVIRVVDNDWFLQTLVNFVNLGDFNFGITLNVGGFLVSGQLIGGKEYFEGFASDFASAITDSEAAEDVRATFAKNGDIYSSEEGDAPPPSYIHIKDARFFNTNGDPIPSNRGVWWRGRISQVDGFSLGSLSTLKS